MTKKPVVAYKIETEEWWSFESITDAAIYCDITEQSVINVMKGVHRQCNGLVFHEYTADFEEQVEAKLNREHNKGQHSKKKILVTDKNDNRVAEYSGIREAARQLGISITTVSRSAHGLRQHKFYNFKIL